MPVIDGENLIFTFDSGITEVDVEADIYSPWKEWALTGDNLKYEKAFRLVTSNTLSTSVESGAYFFFQNQSGWRFQGPPGETITISLTGNLALEDASLPAVISTPLETVLILGLQPVTQNVDAIIETQAANIETLRYQGGVALSPTHPNATAGTDTTLLIGTREKPSSNLPDALTIATSIGSNKIFLMESQTFSSGDASAGFTFLGDNRVLDVLTLDPAVNVANCVFQELQVTGTLDGGALLQNCDVFDILYFNGDLFNCGVRNDVTLGGGAQGNIVDCFSLEAGGVNTPEIDMGGSGQSLTVRGWKGGFTLKNYAGGGDISIDFLSGQFIAAATVTAGDVYVRGNAYPFTDSSTGTANVVNQTTAKVVWEQAMNIVMAADSMGEAVQNMWRFGGLDSANPLTTVKTTGQLVHTTAGQTVTQVETPTDTVTSTKS